MADIQPAATGGVLKSMNRFYEAEARYSASGAPQDRSALLATLHPDIVLHQPPSLPYGGIWRGREAFGQWLDAFVDTWTDITPTDPKLHVCGDDVLIATVTMKAHARSTGKTIEMPMCQVIRFVDGLPIEWRNFAWDTAKMLDALGGSGLQRASYSSVLEQPIAEVWSMIRDFNNYPRYIEGVTESVIEDGKRGDEVGAVRRFLYGEMWIRQRLTAHSDEAHSISYAGMEPFPFPAKTRAKTPPPVNYQGTIKLAPIADGDRTYVEWFVEFDASQEDAPPWKELLSELVMQWVDSLRRTLSGQR